MGIIEIVTETGKPAITVSKISLLELRHLTGRYDMI